jgi:hypothetical protein
MPSRKKARDEGAKPPDNGDAKPPDDKDSKPSKGEGRRPPDGDGERPVGPGNPDADPVRIHEAFVERRVGGGRPATPKAYEQALRQWRRMPGAVRVPPTELTGEEAPPASEAGEEPAQEDRPDDERPR